MMYRRQEVAGIRGGQSDALAAGAIQNFPHFIIINRFAVPLFAPYPFVAFHLFFLLGICIYVIYVYFCFCMPLYIGALWLSL